MVIVRSYRGVKGSVHDLVGRPPGRTYHPETNLLPNMLSSKKTDFDYDQISLSSIYESSDHSKVPKPVKVRTSELGKLEESTFARSLEPTLA